MKKLFIGVVIGLLISAGTLFAQYSTSNYIEQGGARTVIGGSLDVVSGGELDIESGGALKVNGVSILSTAPTLVESQVNMLYTAVATYDFAVDGGAISTIPIGAQIPDNAIILGGFYEVETTLTSATDAATIALSIVAANDLVVAVAISTGTPYDAGFQAIIPKFNTPQTTSVKLTAANQVDVTIAVEAVTAGKFHLTLFYVMGHA